MSDGTCGRVIRLHLGCGRRQLPGYINIDSRQEVDPDIVADATDLPAFDPNTVDEIYACHVLEHIPTPEQVLKKWHQLLRPQGVLRLAVPDVGALVGAYINGIHLRRLEGMIWGGNLYPENRHYRGWDFETLAEDLRENGFYDVRPWNPCQTFPATYSDFSTARLWTAMGAPIDISLNVKAKKADR